MTKDDNGAVTVNAIIQGCKIVIDETFVRETLLIKDLLTFPTEIGIGDAQRILRKMGYESDTQPTMKKLLPSYWRFLAHAFVSCISGRRSGADEISLRNTGAIFSLAAGIGFNFSRFILDEFVVNINATTRDTFLIYPRFVQIFINKQFPDLVKDGDTLDMKSLGPHTIGIIKQNRKGKVVFQGLYPLVKFGRFAEPNEANESYGSSDKISSKHTSSEKVISEGDVIIVSDQEGEETAAPVVSVAEEHDLQDVQVEGAYNEGSSKNTAEPNQFEDLNLTGFDKDDILANFGTNDDFLANINLNSLLDNLSDVAHTATESRDSEDAPEKSGCARSEKHRAKHTFYKVIKSKQISELQDHFNLLTSSYFNLKKKLEKDSGNKYKTSADEHKIDLHSQAHLIAVPTAQTSRVVNRFTEEFAHAPHILEIIRDRQEKAAKKGQILFKRSSDKNASGNRSTVTVTDLESVRFRDTYGDRSGIISWGFHDPLKMWIVRRKSGNT
ncbi:hypothetical protein Lser_V15G25577 [Lactuca serriola]